MQYNLSLYLSPGFDKCQNIVFQRPLPIIIIFFGGGRGGFLEKAIIEDTVTNCAGTGFSNGVHELSQCCRSLTEYRVRVHLVVNVGPVKIRPIGVYRRAVVIVWSNKSV